MSNEIIYSRNLIVYEIVYIPWENNTEGKPWKYIGSTKKDLSVYFGQIRSKRWKDFWVSEVKSNPQNFRKTILCNCIDDNLLELEYIIQKQYNVVSQDEYFNYSYANKNGCFGEQMPGSKNPMYGVRRQEEWKQTHKERQKNSHNTDAYKFKASETQKIVQSRPEVAQNKSIKQKARWQDPTQNLKNSLSVLNKTRQKILFPYTFRQIGEMRKFTIDNNLSNSAVEMQETLEEAIMITEIIRNSQLGGQNRRIIIDYMLGTNKNIPKSLNKYISDNKELLSRYISFVQQCSISTRTKFCSSLI